MNKILLSLLITLSLSANEAVYNGSYMGNYSGVLKNWFKMTYHTFGWIGNTYLAQSSNQDSSQWVVNKKAVLIKEAKHAASKLAKQRQAKRYLIDNITFQVIHTETKNYVYLDCNLVISD